ncbi:MAG: trypsin-like serine protease [Bdellovibrionota bacterium]
MKIQKFFQIILLTLLTSTPGFAKNATPSILNPSLLKSEEVPQMADLILDNGSICSAALVGPRTILTAAHCVMGNGKFGPVNGKTYKVVLTKNPLYDSDSNGSSMNIPYDFAAKHDTAVGILSEDVPGITPLTVTNQAPSLGDTVLTLGAGSPSYKRQYGYVKTITVSPIGVTVRGFGDKPQIGAPGDSGGPNCLVGLDRKILLFGINSTSTREDDWTVRLNWSEAVPYTGGISRAIPEKNQDSDVSFVEDFVNKNSLKVCGINFECDAVYAPESASGNLVQ